MPGSSHAARSAKARCLPGSAQQHRAVAGEGVDHLARGALAAHRNALGHARHRLPSALVAVLVRVLRVQLVHVQVFLVHVEAREAECDGAVVADRKTGQEGLARADGVHAGRAQMRHVAQARRAMGAVRVVGEDGPSGGCELWRDDPVVAAIGGRGVALHGLLLIFFIGSLRPPKHGGRTGQPRVLLGEARRLGGAQVGSAQLGCRNGAGIEARRHLRRDRWIEFAAQPIGLDAFAASAESAGTVDLGCEVEREAVVPDAHHVFRRPHRRLVAQQCKFGRQQRRLRAHLGNVGVDAGGKGLGHALGIGAVGQPLAVHVAAIQHGTRGTVALDPCGAEVLGHFAEAALAPQVHLPEPVARGHEALRNEGVVQRAGIQMRHAPSVDQHLGRFLEAGHGEGRRRARWRLHARRARCTAREREGCDGRERRGADGMPLT